MIFKSATRIVFIIMTTAFIWLTFTWVIEWKDFVNAFLMILSFYFGKWVSPMQEEEKTPKI